MLSEGFVLWSEIKSALERVSPFSKGGTGSVDGALVGKAKQARVLGGACACVNTMSTHSMQYFFLTYLFGGGIGMYLC